MTDYTVQTCKSSSMGFEQKGHIPGTWFYSSTYFHKLFIEHKLEIVYKDKCKITKIKSSEMVWIFTGMLFFGWPFLFCIGSPGRQTHRTIVLINTAIAT